MMCLGVRTELFPAALDMTCADSTSAKRE